jgi:guanyl-specific ribonuclease Sa
MPKNLREDKPKLRPQSLVLGLFVVVLGIYVLWKSSQQHEAKPEPPAVEQRVPEKAEEALPTEAESSEAPAVAERPVTPAGKKLQTKIPNVTVRDQDDKVVFRGTIDVGPTLARIERGEKLRFSHDGIVFENRERRLPKKGSGYYREYVHPTKEIGGPGPQRIVKGKEGEVFYTHDHYQTFLRLDQP